jgi:S1-C subfamily serine protease
MYDTIFDHADPRQRAVRVAELTRLRRTMNWLWLLVLVLGLHTVVQSWRQPAPVIIEQRTVTPRAEPLPEGEQRTIELFDRARDAVVFITTQQRRVDPWTLSVRVIPEGTGSGFIWDTTGHIVTNFHVIQGAAAAEVVLASGTRLPAQLVGASPAHDLAVLRVATGEALKVLPLATSAELRVGQAVLAIGNPFGLDHTLTTGVISALGRRIEGPTDTPIEDAIQTDAAINPGNSGGPLLDSAGRLIGVNCSIYSPSGTSAGIGFAIPVDTVNRVVPQLISGGRYAPPDLGIETHERLGRLVLARLGIRGVLVVNVRAGSPAEVAGLRPTRRARNGSIIPGDVIVAIDDRKIESPGDFAVALDHLRAGQKIRVTFWRDGKTESVELQL